MSLYPPFLKMRLTAIAGVRAAKKARERQMKETQRKEDHVATKTRDLGGLVSNLLLEKKGHISAILITKNKMKPTNPNAHTYVNGTDVKTHGYEVKHNTFLQSFI